VQIFDSWASELEPQDFDIFAGPYIQKIIDSVRKTHPDLTIILYISGSGGLLERMAACKPDVISVDQRVDMRDAIKRIGPSFAVQVPPPPLRSYPCQVIIEWEPHILLHGSAMRLGSWVFMMG
jgi:uroporphyrinogen-III decarboxylase